MTLINAAKLTEVGAARTATAARDQLGQVQASCSARVPHPRSWSVVVPFRTKGQTRHTIAPSTARRRRSSNSLAERQVLGFQRSCGNARLCRAFRVETGMGYFAARAGFNPMI